jgi:signal transduction histidine kinase
MRTAIELKRANYNDILDKNKTIKKVSPEYQELEEEIKSLSIKLREAERGKSDFLSNVRNEINNPLTSVLGLAESISFISKEEKIRRLASLIHEQAFELDFQMRNIIIASEIEMGAIQPMIAQVDIMSLVESQIDYLRLKVNSSQVAIALQATDSVIHPTDSYLLQSVLSNLLANAIEYSGAARKVDVKILTNDRGLLISITDFGEGISIDKQRLLFSRFKQLDSRTTKLHKGQGLGLAIVHELVTILGGTIELNSSEKCGTSITMTFPKPDVTPNVTSSYGNDVIFSDGEEF